MGRGNFCPTGVLTDQWYIDIDTYVSKEENGDEHFLEWEWEVDSNIIMEKICENFKAFGKVKKYLDSYWGQVAMLESRLFWIGVADNEWSMAIWIKERDDLEPELIGLAKMLFHTYQKKIQEILLSMYDDVYRRCGAWTTASIRKAPMLEMKKAE